jgi:hypothetical protein
LNDQAELGAALDPMSFYIRYVLTDDRPVSIGDLEQALRQINPAYAIDGDLIELNQKGYGIIDITHRRDPICDGDLDLLARFAEKRKSRDSILAALRDAKSMVCVQPLSGGVAHPDEVLAPLWDWLLANRAGLLAWEGGHFSNRDGVLK